MATANRVIHLHLSVSISWLGLHYLSIVFVSTVKTKEAQNKQDNIYQLKRVYRTCWLSLYACHWRSHSGRTR